MKLDDAAKIWCEFEAVEDKPRPTLVYADRLKIIKSIQDQALEVAAQVVDNHVVPENASTVIRDLKSKPEPVVDIEEQRREAAIIATLEILCGRLARHEGKRSFYTLTAQEWLLRYKNRLAGEAAVRCAKESHA